MRDDKSSQRQCKKKGVGKGRGEEGGKGEGKSERAIRENREGRQRKKK